MEENSQSRGGNAYTLDSAAVDSTLELWAVFLCLMAKNQWPYYVTGNSGFTL